MLSYDFFCGVSLDALRAGIPGHHISGGIQAIDAVTAHAFHNGAQMQILHPHRLHECSLLSHVANKAHRGASLWRGHRLEHDVYWKLGAILTQPEQILSNAHQPGARAGMKLTAMGHVEPPESLRDQEFNTPAQKFL